MAYPAPMQCDRCGALVSTGAVFPGAKIRCSCGAELVVQDEAPSRSGAGPFRLATPPEEPSEPRPTTAATTTERPCPRCGAELHAEWAHEEQVLGCPSCRGALVDHDSLARAARAAHDDQASRQERVSHPPRLEHDVHYLKCPLCRQVMARVNFGQRSGILVDTCKMHGTWFDAGELDSVLIYVAQKGLDALSPSLASSDVLAREVKVMESALALENQRETQHFVDAVDLAGDFLSFLFAGDSWRWRRGRF